MLNSEYTLQETMRYADARKWTDQQLLQDIDLRIKKGEDINACDDSGTTALMSAATENRILIVKRLIELGADLTKNNKWKEDVLACAKYTQNKELIDYVKGALKGIAQVKLSKESYYRPNLTSGSEYTFYPSSKFKKKTKSDADDVGYFLNKNEILQLCKLKDDVLKSGARKMHIDEGVVTIIDKEWTAMTESQLKPMLIKSKIEIHDINCIIREYLSE